MDAKTFTVVTDLHDKLVRHCIVGFPADEVCGAFIAFRTELGGGEFKTRCTPDEARAIAKAILAAADYADPPTARAMIAEDLNAPDLGRTIGWITISNDLRTIKSWNVESV